jgi:hypothetical protein
MLHERFTLLHLGRIRQILRACLVSTTENHVALVMLTRTANSIHVEEII